MASPAAAMACVEPVVDGVELDVEPPPQTSSSGLEPEHAGSKANAAKLAARRTVLRAYRARRLLTRMQVKSSKPRTDAFSGRPPSNRDPLSGGLDEPSLEAGNPAEV